MSNRTAKQVGKLFWYRLGYFTVYWRWFRFSLCYWNV